MGLTDENLQSRIRGVLLMALSNARGWIVLTTGNKSEMATGYSTLYGDSAGGFAVIKDVPKLLVYALCRYRNRLAGFELIPEAVLIKAPSAELRPDQRDDESLPPYAVLDPVVAGYVEGDRSVDDLIAEGFDPAAVERVVGLVDRAEYKRRQMPPGVRISGKAFGKDRRMPITNHYRSRAERAAAGRRRRRTLGSPTPGRWFPTVRAARPRPLSDLSDRPVADHPVGGSAAPLTLEAAAAAPRGVPLDRARPLPTPRGVGGGHAHRRRPGPPRRPEHAPRLARRAVGRAAARPGRCRPGRLDPPSAPTAALFAALSGEPPPAAGPGSRGRPPTRRPSAIPGPCPGWPASTGWCCPVWSPPTSAISGWSAP